MSKSLSKLKVMVPEDLAQVCQNWQKSGQKVVFTNGCFDILHLGHVEYLEQAAQLGDKLVIGLNTDRSVNALKGPERPVNPEYARALVLASLGFVDAVCLFDEDTPLDLIKKLSPDCLVKGGDYVPETVVGAKFVEEKGGKVFIIPLTEGFSTTSLINKLSK
jgi:D-glycero-beta-D-manno-heptose 1-phosphate adenylyltransferase